MSQNDVVQNKKYAEALVKCGYATSYDPIYDGRKIDHYRIKVEQKGDTFTEKVDPTTDTLGSIEQLFALINSFESEILTDDIHNFLVECVEANI